MASSWDFGTYPSGQEIFFFFFFFFFFGGGGSSSKSSDESVQTGNKVEI